MNEEEINEMRRRQKIMEEYMAVSSMIPYAAPKFRGKSNPGTAKYMSPINGLKSLYSKGAKSMPYMANPVMPGYGKLGGNYSKGYTGIPTLGGKAGYSAGGKGGAAASASASSSGSSGSGK